MKPRALRSTPERIRMILAVAVVILFGYALLAPGLGANAILGIIVKTQFSALLYGTGILGAGALIIILVSLVTGRTYCSVLCPLGTLQELVWRAGRFLRKGESLHYRNPPKLRYLVPLLTGLGVILASGPLMIALDPLSTFGRGMNALRETGGGIS
ncbi:MAG: 4Fe-4S binding protein, partial [Treponema sp.]|nr:4Fe-4S binding protein [Treponema sp.]